MVLQSKACTVSIAIVDFIDTIQKINGNTEISFLTLF